MTLALSYAYEKPPGGGVTYSSLNWYETKLLVYHVHRISTKWKP